MMDASSELKSRSGISPAATPRAASRAASRAATLARAGSELQLGLDPSWIQRPVIENSISDLSYSIQLLPEGVLAIAVATGKVHEEDDDT